MILQTQGGFSYVEIAVVPFIDRDVHYDIGDAVHQIGRTVTGTDIRNYDARPAPHIVVIIADNSLDFR